MAPGCKPGGLTPYAGSNPAPCTRRVSNFGMPKIHWAGVAQLVEHQPSKLRVASSNLVARSRFFVPSYDLRPRSSGVERLLGKEEVMSSNLIAGSRNSQLAYER
jgi:hypothetical protein